MNQQIQELIKKKDIKGALEILKSTNNDAKLVYADYLNEKELSKSGFSDEQEWENYLDELFIRLKQLDEEGEDNEYASFTGVTQKRENEKRVKPKLFISYNHQDQEIVSKIAKYLDGHVEYFVDYISMNSGDIIKDRISKEIVERDYFLVLISKNSLQSPWVCLEGVVASMKSLWTNGKFIPIRIDEALFDNKFLNGVLEKMRMKIVELENDIASSRKYTYGHKHFDTERQLYTDFINNYDTMLDNYRKTASINISGDLFEHGINNLIKSIIA